MIDDNRYFRRNRQAVVFDSACFYITALLVVAVLIVPVLPKTAYTNTNPSVVATAQRIIVIDPGHGGHDHGVIGAQGLSEKQVMLEIARHISERLGSEFKVQLTRTGNYNMDIRSRMSIANNHKADLFLSLHAGGSSRSGVSGWTVYHHQLKTGSQNFSGNEQAPFFWNQLQQRHISAATRLAANIGKRLEAGAAGQPVDIIGAPLAVLSGANMPAVLVETGYLTHPPTARSLAQVAFVKAIADDIAGGIRDFFEK